MIFTMFCQGVNFNYCNNVPFQAQHNTRKLAGIYTPRAKPGIYIHHTGAYISLPGVTGSYSTNAVRQCYTMEEVYDFYILVFCFTVLARRLATMLASMAKLSVPYKVGLYIT